LKSATGRNDPNVNLGTHVLNTLNDAAAGGSNLIGEVVGATKTFMNGDKSSVSQIAKNLVETVDSSYNKLLSSTGNGKNNANFTVLLSIGDLNDNHGAARKINSSSSIESKYFDKNHQETTADFKLDWIITNFTFKPSMQFEMVKENGGEFPKPLWMDFDVSLETRLSLSNKYVYQTIIPQALTTKINP
jgi:hypothetical protein